MISFASKPQSNPSDPANLNALRTKSDEIIVRAIKNSPAVTSAMKGAWSITLATGLEQGFFIYCCALDGSFYPGRTMTGTKDRLPGLLASLLRPGLYSVVEAWFHTHPGNFPGVGGADVADQAFGRFYNSITIIKSREGILIGR